jgi:hypothetical protein
VDSIEMRLHELETKVADVRVTQASTMATLEHVAGVAENLQRGVETLNETISKGKGAMMVIGGAGIAGGAIIHWVLDVLAGHK